ICSIGLSSRPGASGALSSPLSRSASPPGAAARRSSVGVEVVEFDIQVLLIRCLESELYAAIVALSIILGGPSWGIPFDAAYGGTCPLGEKLCGSGREVRPRRDRLGWRPQDGYHRPAPGL